MVGFTEEMKNALADFEEQNGRTPLRVTDRLLPVANISKIMKGSIPKIAKVSKDSKGLMQQSASEFIAIVTCRAKEICEIEARKTITGDDLIRAMDDLDMPYYAEITRKYYEQYRTAVDEGRGRKGPHGPIGF